MLVLVADVDQPYGKVLAILDNLGLYREQVLSNLATAKFELFILFGFDSGYDVDETENEAKTAPNR